MDTPSKTRMRNSMFSPHVDHSEESYKDVIAFADASWKAHRVEFKEDAHKEDWDTFCPLYDEYNKTRKLERERELELKKNDPSYKIHYRPTKTLRKPDVEFEGCTNEKHLTEGKTFFANLEMMSDFDRLIKFFEYVGADKAGGCRFFPHPDWTPCKNYKERLSKVIFPHPKIQETRHSPHVKNFTRLEFSAFSRPFTVASFYEYCVVRKLIDPQTDYNILLALIKEKMRIYLKDADGTFFDEDTELINMHTLCKKDPCKK